ncbi:hypothetical protein ACFVMC_25815 [Nocardia sp. NPDC127579]|uniref:hypothetical protein n=1 Tax=Nocardia sp. NPDC127579 TaxID=3345402 RepID=UPI00362B0E7D
MTPTSAEPELYEVLPDGTPLLRGVRDSSGFVSFPYQDAGSLLTGEHGADLTPVALSGLGRVQALVTVGHHPDGDGEAPCTIASIALAEGPMVRGVLIHADQARPGCLVRATTVAAPGGAGTRDLRFAPIPEEL